MEKDNLAKLAHTFHAYREACIMRGEAINKTVFLLMESGVDLETATDMAATLFPKEDN